MNKKILITGVSGLLGYQLLKEVSIKDNYELFGVYNDTKVIDNNSKLIKFDLRKKSELNAILEKISPDIIIHTAALVSTIKCENLPVEAKKINVDVTRYLKEYCDEKNKKLIFISTDYLFDGVKGNYNEDDKLSPLNEYGRNKVDSEMLVKELENYTIIRTAFFGKIPYKRNKLGYDQWILEEIRTKDRVECYDNHIFTPISSVTLSKIIISICDKDLKGIFNVCSDNKLSKYDFARKVAKIYGINMNKIFPIKNDNPKIPVDSSLNNLKIKTILKIEKIDVDDEITIVKNYSYSD